MNVLFCRKDTPWGPLYLRARAGKLCGLSSQWTPTACDTEVASSEDSALAATERWLDYYIAGIVSKLNNSISLAAADISASVDYIPALDLTIGTPFQRLVWEETLQISWGQMLTYGALAQKVATRSGKQPCARAVGQALHVNPWMILIPCHRVVQAGRRLGGYAGGTDLKASLLFHEGIEQL